MSEKKKVAVLTDFEELDPKYGLTPVVLSQLRMLSKFGYKPGFFVKESFEAMAEITIDKEYTTIKYPRKELEFTLPLAVELKPFIPFMHLYDYQDGTIEQVHDIGPIGEHGPPAVTNFAKQVELIEQYLEPEISKYDVVLTHDALYQGWMVVINKAIRNIGSRHPEIKWIHWCHSSPANRPPASKRKYPVNLRYMDMSNSLWVSPNSAMASGFALQYDVQRNRVRVIHHVVDWGEYYGWLPITEQIIEKHSLLEGDIVCVWPVRFDHPKGKGLKYAVWIVGCMNRLCNAKLVFINSQASSKQMNKVVKNLKKEAKEWGLPEENLVFTSEMDKKYLQGMPRAVVHQLFEIGNLFILASESETQSLVMLEAMADKNICVINKNLPLKEVTGDHVLYTPFPAHWADRLTQVDYGDPKEYFMEEARRIWDGLQRVGEPEWVGMKHLVPYRAHRYVLRRHSEKYIWEREMKPLIEGDW